MCSPPGAGVCVGPAVGTHSRTVLATYDVVMSSGSGWTVPAALDHGAVMRRCLEPRGITHMVQIEYRPMQYSAAR